MATKNPDELEVEISTSAKRLVKLYPKMEKHFPASWIYFSQKEGIKPCEQLQEPCHVEMISSKSNTWDEMITAFPHTDSLSVEYLKMLGRGPFQAYRDVFSVQKLGEANYIHIIELDHWPANVLYNFCIATRVPLEHNYLMPHWGQLCEKGYDPTLAYMISWSKAGSDKFSKTGRPFPPYGHYWHDNTADWSRILKGDFLKPSSSFRESPKSCRPTNVIWGTDFETNGKLKKMTDEEILDFFQMPVKPPEQEDPAPIPKKAKKLKPLLVWQLPPVNPVPNDEIIFGLPQPDVPQPDPVMNEEWDDLEFQPDELDNDF